jgi:hypothetical protein
MLVPNTPRSRLPGVFITGESFWTPAIHFADFKEHTLSVGHFNYLGTYDSSLKKLLTQGILFNSAVFITGESIYKY